MSSTLPLSIAYCNVRGLDDTTYNDLVSSIHSNDFQLYCLSETWFMNMHQYQSHSFYISDSTYPINPHFNRRQDGGLFLFASPSIKDNCTVIHRSQYSIVVNIQPSNKRICFVYFPPSLSDNVIANELKVIGKIDLFIGDINVRLGEISGDSISTATSRKSTIYSHLSSYSLDYLRNKNIEISSRTDHLYTNLPSLSWIHETNLPFNTDHGRMRILTSLPFIRNDDNTGTHRFDFKPLYNTAFQQDFISRYDAKYSQLLLLNSENAIDACCHSMILPDTQTCQTIVDETYNTFIYLIRMLLHETLTTYDAHSVKSTKDHLLATSNNPPPSTVQAIRIFKRNQRKINSNHPIVSDNPALTPLQECSQYYRQQYASMSLPPEISRQNDTLFGLLFTEEKIKTSLLKYPLHKSVGPDGIHTLVFKVLARSDQFMSCITILFQLFATTSLVPSDWNNCQLHLLIKNQNQRHIASNTRPIALSNILRRIFEKLLLRNWMSLS